MSLLTDQEIDALRGPGGYVDPRAVEAATIAKLAGVSVEPVAHLKFWAAQRVSPDGGVEADEGLETCRAGEVGMDGVAAEPVYTATQLAAARVQALEQAATVSEQSFAGDDGVVIAWRIRALIGGHQ